MGEIKKMVDLDECVLNALNLFSERGITKIKVKFSERILVVGSGNALSAGKILTKNNDVLYADESNYISKLKSARGIRKALLISSSGGKHSPGIAKNLRGKGINVTLLTNNDRAKASEFCNNTEVFPKNTEPYTYNVSTYLGMILAKTKENPKNIMNFLNSIEKSIPKNLNKFDSFFIIVPSEFEELKEMFSTKFDELFGSRITGRVFTPEQAKHAKTVVQSQKELFVSFGYNNKMFGKKRINISLPKTAGYGALLCAGYYFIGKIQKQNRQYFKENISEYVKQTSKVFGEKIEVVVK